MKAKVNAKAFAPILADMARITPKRPIIPVTGNVKLTAEDGKLVAEATNLEIALTRWVEAQIDKEGSTTVPAETLADLMSSMGDQSVSFALDASGASLKISGGGVKSKLRTISAEDFPYTKPAEAPALSFSIASDDLVGAIRQVVFAASKETARPTLASICMRVKPGEAIFFGADGYRMSRKVVAMNYDGDTAELLIPSKSAQEIVKLVSDAGQCEISAWSNGMEIAHLTVETPTGMLRLLLTAEQYPDMHSFYQQSLAVMQRATASVEALRNACRVALVFAKDVPGNAGTISIVAGENGDMGKLVFGSHTAETGAADATVDAIIPADADLEIGFNLAMLAEGLAVMPDGQVAFGVESPGSPGFFKIVGQDDFLYVIMPMRGGRREAVD